MFEWLEVLGAAEIPGVKEGFDTWKEYGFAGLFVLVFLVVFAYLLWELRSSKKEVVYLTKSTVEAIERSNGAHEKLVEGFGKLQGCVDKNTTETSNLTTYMKTRDQFIGGGGGGRNRS